jgi:Synergist-CTERM protein sorting domain-containing protein
LALNDLHFDAASLESDDVNVDILIKKVDVGDTDNNNLTEWQTAALEGLDVRGVYEVTLLIGGGKAGGEEGFNTRGTITVGLPCALNPGETGDGTWAVYLDEVDEDTPPALMTEGRRYAGGMTIFDTRHLSTYGATYAPAQTSVDGGGSGGCAAGTGGVLALLALAFALRKKER